MDEYYFHDVVPGYYFLHSIKRKIRRRSVALPHRLIRSAHMIFAAEIVESLLFKGLSYISRHHENISV